jgi:transcriptional regulator with XRE-family HTH domain
MTKTFGEFIKAKRLAARVGLRLFAKMIGMQPSNYCNIESGSLKPPAPDIVDRIGKALSIRPSDDEYALLCDLAARERDEVAADIKRIIEERDLIPAMLRTLENEHVTEKQLRGIMDDLRSGKYKQG